MFSLLLLLLACRPDDPPADSPAGEDTAAGPPAWCPEAPEAPELDAWTLGGHAPGGTATYVVRTPDPDLVYLGALYGGLYTSRDRGATWQHVGVRGPPHAFGQLALDPADPTRLLYSAGPLYLYDGEAMTQLDVGDTTSHRVRGAVWLDDAIVVVDALGWVYRAASVDGPFAYLARLPAESVPSGSAAEGGAAVDGSGEGGAPPPDQTAHTIDASYWMLAYDGTSLWAAQQGGALHRSLDLGETWRTVLDGPVGAHSLVVGDGEMWVAEADRLLSSTDGGETFDLRGETAAPVVSGALGPDGALVFSDGAKLYFVEDGRVGSYVSAPEDSVTGLGWLSDGTLLLGQAEGLLRSVDRGESWEDASTGFWDDNLSIVYAHPECPGLVWVGTECQRGLYRSTDWGATWEHDPAYMHYVMGIAANPGRPQEIWVTTDDTVYVSPDLGATWETRPPDAVHLHGLGVDPWHPDVVLVGTVGSGDYADDTGRVWRTEDAGATWSTATGIPEFSGSVHTFVFSPTVEDLVLAGTYKGGTYHEDGVGVGLYRSVDGGRDWARVLPEEDDILEVAACGDRFYALTEASLYVSEDSGESWEDRFGGRLVGVDCDGEVVRARDYAVVWESHDGGVSWSALDGSVYSGAERLGVAEDLDAGMGMLYATENGGGVYRMRAP